MTHSCACAFHYVSIANSFSELFSNLVKFQTVRIVTFAVGTRNIECVWFFEGSSQDHSYVRGDFRAGTFLKQCFVSFDHLPHKSFILTFFFGRFSNQNERALSEMFTPIVKEMDKTSSLGFSALASSARAESFLILAFRDIS